MRFLETCLKGAFVIEPEPAKDSRGYFARTFCRKEFQNYGLNTEMVQCNISYNTKKGTLRGMHYQAEPYEEAKLVSCLKGSIFDVIIDLRPGSDTYLQWFAVELSADNHRMIYVPEGFAHGFQSLEDETEVFYQMSAAYLPEYARGVRWDDPVIRIKWPLANPVMSDRDRKFALLPTGGASVFNFEGLASISTKPRVRMHMIPVFKPLIECDEIEASRRALELGWLGMGSYVAEFEEAIRNYIGCSDRYVAAVSTGHAALHLGLLIAGVGGGDEVITPSFNNIADFQAILAVGAEPVLCDIDDYTLCIDLDKAEQLVTPRTKAIIVMDYDCILCNHTQVAEFASKHNVRVIHDAAHAFGSKYHGETIGSFSDICIFSFDPVKTITSIDGGALVVRTEEEIDMIHEMRLIGMGQSASLMYRNERAWTYDVKRIGFRYHLANIHAAIGLAQLRKIDMISETRRAACLYYNKRLIGIPGLTVPKTDFTDITPFLYYIRVPEIHRDDLSTHMKELGIETGIHWRPGHCFTLLKDCRKGDLSITERVGKEILSLPLHSFMQPGDLEKVVDSIASFFGRGIEL